MTTIFQYNAFSTTDVIQSAVALEAFAVGVCGFILVKVLAPGFFARQDTKTPMQIGVIAVIVNVILSVILVRTMAHAGLALAISIAAWVNAILLLLVLLSRKIYQPQRDWWWFMLRIAVAVAIMCGCLIVLNEANAVWFQKNLAQRVISMFILVAAGAGSYFLSLVILGIRPRQLLLAPKLS